MAGAYNAREPADPADPGFPPGWPGYPWPFPGPYPPGYTPTLSLAMTATDSIAFNGIVSVTGSARDQSTYATNEPSAITWVAKDQEGIVVNLRFSGDEDYSSSISSTVSFGTYWGATPSIEFELTEDNIDDVVTLTGYYTLDEIQVVQTEDIVIGVTTVTIEFVSNTATNAQWGAAVEIKGQESGEDAIGRVGLEWTEADVETEDEISVEKTTTTMTIQVDLLREEIYDVAIGYANLSPNTINMSWTATVNFIGEDPTETVKSEAVASMDYFNVFPSLDTVWITIDGTDGTVTVINP